MSKAYFSKTNKTPWSSLFFSFLSDILGSDSLFQQNPSLIIMG
jgi:hypothetical protein